MRCALLFFNSGYDNFAESKKLHKKVTGITPNEFRLTVN